MSDINSLIKSCLSDNAISWNQLVEEWTPLALGILRKRYSAIIDDHNDIIQNIFTKLAVNGLKNFHGTTKYEFISYFKKITIREAYSYLRQNKDDCVRLDQDFSSEDSNSETSLKDQIPDGKILPDTIAEINDLYRKAMEQLSIRDKQILLFKIEGYKDKEIADILNIPMGTVATSYNRTKEFLQKILMISCLMMFFERNF